MALLILETVRVTALAGLVIAVGVLSLMVMPEVRDVH